MGKSKQRKRPVVFLLRRHHFCFFIFLQERVQLLFQILLDITNLLSFNCDVFEQWPWRHENRSLAIFYWCCWSLLKWDFTSNQSLPNVSSTPLHHCALNTWRKQIFILPWAVPKKWFSHWLLVKQWSRIIFKHVKFWDWLQLGLQLLYLLFKNSEVLIHLVKVV